MENLGNFNYLFKTINMGMVSPLIIAVLLYKLKLLDDRKNNNLDRFKNYIKRRTEPHNGLYEQDEWLEKDIRYHLMALYETSEGTEGHRQAILDYYKDYRDNEGTKIILVYLIILNMLCFIGGQSINELLRLIGAVALTIISIYLCLKGPKVTLFNNPLVNVDNSMKIRDLYSKTQKEIEHDIRDCKRKYIDSENKEGINKIKFIKRLSISIMIFKIHRKKMLNIAILFFGDLLSLLFMFEDNFLVGCLLLEDSKPLPGFLKTCSLGVLFILLTLKLYNEIMEFLDEIRQKTGEAEQDSFQKVTTT